MVVGPFLVSLKKLKVFLYRKLSLPIRHFLIANISRLLVAFSQKKI